MAAGIDMRFFYSVYLFKSAGKLRKTQPSRNPGYPRIRSDQTAIPGCPGIGPSRVVMKKTF